MVAIRPSNAKEIELPDGSHIKAIEANPKDTFRFDCLRCGKCCSYSPSITPKDASRIANYLQISRQDFFKKYLTMTEDDYYGWRVSLYKTGENCAFYSKDNGKGYCKIHIAKPKKCQVIPFGILGDNDNKSIEISKIIFRPCRGEGRGKERTVGEWMKTINATNVLKEEAEYALKVAEMKTNMPRGQLREKIEEMFTS